MLVDTDEICAAIKDVFEDTRIDPRAGRRAGGRRRSRRGCARQRLTDRTLVAITCGANMNFDRLRFVAERAEVGEEREALFAVTIPEQPGSFREFCALLGTRNVTEFNYRYADRERRTSSSASRSRDRRETADVAARRSSGTASTALDLTDDEMAKLHVRHMVGGRAARRAARDRSTASSSPSARAR